MATASLRTRKHRLVMNTVVLRKPPKLLGDSTSGTAYDYQLVGVRSDSRHYYVRPL